MRKTALAVAALVAALSLGTTADRAAAAMQSATPIQLGLANADTGLVQKARVVCGQWGCRRVVRAPGGWVGPRRPLYAFAGPRRRWSRPAWGWSSPLGVGPAVLSGVGVWAGAVQGGLVSRSR